MMFKAFILASSPRTDHERVVGLLGHLPEIGRRAAPDSLDRFAGATLVDTEATIDPVELAAFLCRLRGESGNDVLGQEMVLLLDVAAMNGVGMRLLLGEWQKHRSFIGEHINRVAAPDGNID